jgi:hypothetical protein
MKAIFYDASATMLKKNHYPVVDYFFKKNPDFQSVFISNETGINIYSQKNKIDENELLNLNNSSFMKFKTFNHKKLSKLLKKEKPDFLIIAGYRIYDQLITAICNNENINIYKLQHGFEIDSVNYKIKSILLKTTKVIRLLAASLNLGFVSNSDPFLLSLYYTRYILTGSKLKNTLLDNKLFHPTLIFVYSDYYKEFWFNKFGLDKSKMVYITPSDFSIINKIHKKQKQKGCCYIAQTLVEDGRLSKNEFIALLKEYESIVKSVSSFVIKTHPRSDISNYSVLTKYPNVTITNELPNCNSYLTHYSSLIYTVAFLSKNIIIHELNGHETPEVFKQINPKICNTVSEIIKTLKDTSIEALPSIDILKKKLKYFVEFEDIDPYENIYNNITINLNK